MRLDWHRVARGSVLLAWGGFFCYLELAGRATSYVGPKTAWVITAGAFGLPLCALAHLARVRVLTPVPAPSVRELGGLGVLLAPLAFALVIPAPTLGALAVANKRSAQAAPPLDVPIRGPVRLFEIAWAAGSPRYAAQNHLTAGKAVDFTGFVSRTLPGGSVELSRFYVTCCVADALAYSVTVRPGGRWPKLARDEWVHVNGRLIGTAGRDLSVRAASARRIQRPARPFN